MYDHLKVTNHRTKDVCVSQVEQITVKVERVMKDEEEGKDRTETVDNIIALN
jgi:hypothetical protein